MFELDDVQPYERSTGATRYNYFQNFQNILPVYIWDQLIGITPQRRRAYLLQAKYVTPLTFSYALLGFFSQFAVNVGVLYFVRLLWDHFGKSDVIMFALIAIAFVAAYLVFRWSQAKNTKTIQEEMTYRTVIDSLSLFFAVVAAFDLNDHWQPLIEYFKSFRG